MPADTWNRFRAWTGGRAKSFRIELISNVFQRDAAEACAHDAGASKAAASAATTNCMRCLTPLRMTETVGLQAPIPPEVWANRQLFALAQALLRRLHHALGIQRMGRGAIEPRDVQPHRTALQVKDRPAALLRPDDGIVREHLAEA